MRQNHLHDTRTIRIGIFVTFVSHVGLLYRHIDLVNGERDGEDGHSDHDGWLEVMMVSKACCAIVIGEPSFHYCVIIQQVPNKYLALEAKPFLYPA